MASMSAIGIAGLPHRLTFKRWGFVDDGAGGIKRDSSGTTIYANRRGRVSRLDKNEDELKIVGLDSAKTYRLVMVYSPDIQREDVCTIAAGTPAPAGEYTVRWIDQQIDEHGKFHHTSILVEAEA